LTDNIVGAINVIESEPDVSCRAITDPMEIDVCHRLPPCESLRNLGLEHSGQEAVELG
jgi:hypothetical protein